MTRFAIRRDESIDNNMEEIEENLQVWAPVVCIWLYQRYHY